MNKQSLAVGIGPLLTGCPQPPAGKVVVVVIDVVVVLVLVVVVVLVVVGPVGGIAIARSSKVPGPVRPNAPLTKLAALGPAQNAAAYVGVGQTVVHSAPAQSALLVHALAPPCGNARRPPSGNAQDRVNAELAPLRAITVSKQERGENTHSPPPLGTQSEFNAQLVVGESSQLPRNGVSTPHCSLATPASVPHTPVKQPFGSCC